MKKLLWLFLLIVAISVAAPGFLGMQAEGHYKAVVRQLEDAGYHIADHTYARGWFSSDARLQLELPVPETSAPDAERPRLLVRTHAVHGPFLGAAEQSFGLARLDSEIWLGSQPLVAGGGDPPVRTLIGFLGSGRTIIRVPPRQLSFAGGTLDMAAIAGEFAFGAGDQLAVGELSLPTLRAQDSDGVAGELAGVKLALDLRRGPDNLPLGVWRFGLDRMAFSAPADAKAFAVDGLEISGSSELHDGAMDVAADYRVRALSAEGETYGPLDLRLTAKRLAVEALARIQAAVEEAAASGATAEQRSEALGVAVLANADALLAKDPSIGIERLVFDMPEGRVSAALELRASGLKAADLRNAATALQRIHGKASLRMPEAVLEALLRQQGRQQLIALAKERAEDEQPSVQEIEAAAAQFAAQQIENLVAQQILVRDGGAAVVAAELRNGLLTVNGKTIPLTGFLQRPAD